MTWKIELSEGSGPVIADMLEAQQAWKRLSEPARAAVVAAYSEGAVTGHPATLAALKRHGFTHCGRHTNFTLLLTDAGKAVARWNVGKP